MTDLLSIEKNTDPRGGYVLKAECILPRPVEEVFPFFADAYNLEKLTPSFLKFNVTTPSPIDMKEGQIIDYRLRVRGIPLRWQSEITAWEPPYRFIDEARRSPYTHWHHEHAFEECPEGTRATDVVHYGVPGGPLQPLIHTLFVRRDVEKIFNYRQEVLREMFG